MGWESLPGGRGLGEWAAARGAGAHTGGRPLAELCAALAGSADPPEGAEAGTVPLHKRKGTGRDHLLDSTRELADMGFEARQALGALLETDGDVVRAINSLASAD